MTAEGIADRLIHESIILGKYYAWSGGSGVRDDYSRTIVRFKKGEASAVEFFTGKVARRIKSDDNLNRPGCILVPVPSSKAHDAQRPHRGELLCQAVAAVPGIKVTYGNYVIRHTTINSSHGRSVGSRPSVEEHLKTLEIRIPALSGKYVSKLGSTQWKTLDAILLTMFDTLGRQARRVPSNFSRRASAGSMPCIWARISREIYLRLSRCGSQEEWINSGG